MRRLVLLGLLGLGACKEEPPAVEPPKECPVPSTHPQALPTATRALAARDEDGREPVLVRFRPSIGVHAAALREDLVARVGGKVKYHWPRLRMLAARLSPEAREALARNPEILSIEPDHPVHALGSPNPSGHPGEYTEGVKRVQAPEVWDANGDGMLDPGTPTGEGIKVCVIDSGIDDRHPELKVAYVPGQGLGKDFIDEDDDPRDQDANGVWGGGHGTHVAAIIAAQLGMGGRVDPRETSLHPNGMVGAAPGATLLIARVLDTSGSGSMSDVIEALQWCQLRGAHIASLSLGSPKSSAADKAAFDAAWAGGMISIAASGNAGNNNPSAPPPVIYPAAYDSVIAVGAVDSAGQHPTFSQTGEHLRLVAPGVEVLSATVLGEPFSEVEACGVQYPSVGLEYSGLGAYTGPLVDCGQAPDSLSCSRGTAEGFVAYVESGPELLGETVRKVREQGARAVIIANTDPTQQESLFTLGGPGAWPPVVAVPGVTGEELAKRVGLPVRVGLVGSDYVRRSGTSMATPHVSAVAALLWSARPSLTQVQVRDLLERSAKDLGPPGRDPTFGFGLVQARAALELMAKEFPVPGASSTP
jgi:subtilisin family serine protease